ncbi:hypothetical protein GCM10008023_15950 [Sphingomonas glacialis]|uniref:Uncharacterized protein n=1 Tax=Sphingomonas glacialis TaxID=658225 RepID=A0ABQ3LIS8_9SPHN|nr:hypothetical protein GCM10008023_15950 [Sphingomonas glacialis]
MLEGGRKGGFNGGEMSAQVAPEKLAKTEGSIAGCYRKLLLENRPGQAWPKCIGNIGAGVIERLAVPAQAN